MLCYDFYPTYFWLMNIDQYIHMIRATHCLHKCALTFSITFLLYAGIISHLTLILIDGVIKYSRSFLSHVFHIAHNSHSKDCNIIVALTILSTSSTLSCTNMLFFKLRIMCKIDYLINDWSFIVWIPPPLLGCPSYQDVNPLSVFLHWGTYTIVICNNTFKENFNQH